MQKYIKKTVVFEDEKKITKRFDLIEREPSSDLSYDEFKKLPTVVKENMDVRLRVQKNYYILNIDKDHTNIYFGKYNFTISNRGNNYFPSKTQKNIFAIKDNKIIAYDTPDIEINRLKEYKIDFFKECGLDVSITAYGFITKYALTKIFQGKIKNNTDLIQYWASKKYQISLEEAKSLNIDLIVNDNPKPTMLRKIAPKGKLNDILFWINQMKRKTDRKEYETFSHILPQLVDLGIKIEPYQNVGQLEELRQTLAKKTVDILKENGFIKETVKYGYVPIMENVKLVTSNYQAEILRYGFGESWIWGKMNQNTICFLVLDNNRPINYFLYDISTREYIEKSINNKIIEEVEKNLENIIEKRIIL